MEIQRFIMEDSAKKAILSYIAKLNADFADKFNNAIKVITKNIAGQTLIEDFKKKMEAIGQENRIEITNTAIIIENLSDKRVSLEFSDYNLSSLFVPLKSISFDEYCKIIQTKLFLVAAIHSLLPQHELITDRIEYGHGWQPRVFSTPKDFIQEYMKEYYYYHAHGKYDNYNAIEEYPSFSYGLLVSQYYYVQFHTEFEPDNSFIFCEKCEPLNQREKQLNISSWS